MTTDKREAEIRERAARTMSALRVSIRTACNDDMSEPGTGQRARHAGRVESMDIAIDMIEALLVRADEQADQLATLRQSLSDALAIAQDWERQSRAAADSLLLVGMERDSLRQSLSAAEATIAAQADLAEKRRDEIEAAEARVGEMREALEPWKAVCAQLVKPNFLDCESVLFDAWGNAVGTVGDLRRAARASD